MGGEGPAFNPLDWYHTLLESSQTTTPSRPYCITQPAVYSKPPPNYEKQKQQQQHVINKSGDPARNTLLGLNDEM